MFSDPIKNLKQLGIREDMIIADLGAGTGFYSIAAGSLVSNGKVYAVEIIKDYVVTIKNKAKEAHLHNVECFWGNIEKIGGTKIKDNIVDVVICSNVLFQIADVDMFVKEIKRISKIGGRILFIDWAEESILGPKKNKIIPKNTIIEIFKKKGFEYERDISAGEHHYGMILVNKSAVAEAMAGQRNI